MKKVYVITTAAICFLVILLALNRPVSEVKVNGVSFVAPGKPISVNEMKDISKINAGWVAIIPYAFSRADAPEVYFNHERQWWGERVDGAIETIKMAKSLGYKIMIKPQVWVRGHGWPGDYKMDNESSWEQWQMSYKKYILTYAEVAESLQVEMLCIGTEYRKAAVERRLFWKALIEEVRKVYSGKLTYAANWDNFENISFWSDLDYIGIDAYFPLSNAKTPVQNDLKASWEAVFPNIKAIHQKYDLPILFTEYGYQSIDYTAAGHWNYNQDTLAINLDAQAQAYEALFQSVWSQDWFAGGFLWKWHAWHDKFGGVACKRYTPQNKPAQLVIARWYGHEKSPITK